MAPNEERVDDQQVPMTRADKIIFAVIIGSALTVICAILWRGYL